MPKAGSRPKRRAGPARAIATAWPTASPCPIPRHVPRIATCTIPAWSSIRAPIAGGIPTGAEEPFAGLEGRLGALALDEGFAILEARTSFAVAGAGRRVSVDFLGGYRYAQVFAPKDTDDVALEPMTAPTSALTSGRGLRVVAPGGQFRAAFRIRVEA